MHDFWLTFKASSETPNRRLVRLNEELDQIRQDQVNCANTWISTLGIDFEWGVSWLGGEQAFKKVDRGSYAAVCMEIKLMVTPTIDHQQGE